MSLKHNIIAIIPARYGSSRFPGKPLAMVKGVPMVERTWRQVKAVTDNVIVATDDERIAAEVRRFGGCVVISQTTHTCGTERCLEAYSLCHSDADIVLNVQCDEPFILPEQIQSVIDCFDSPEVEIASLALRTDERIDDPNTPKVVMDNNHNALYFSRATIPYGKEMEHYTHIGIYGFRAPVLARLCALEPSALERAESLEQLRWLQGGYKIRMAITDTPVFGINTIEDLQ